MRSIILLLVLLNLVSTNVNAAREIEPNDHWLQATLIDGNEPVSGALNDEQDVYKLLLPEPGEVTITLDEFPDGSNLTLEVLGFRKDPIVPINKAKSHGKDRVRVHFDAQERIGYLAISATPVEKVCKDQWCIMRLVVNGPYYLLNDGPTLPASWNGHPIIEPPEYQLSILHPGLVREQQEQEDARLAYANLPLFNNPATGMQFRYQPDWEARTAASGSGEIKPTRHDADTVKIVIAIRDKAAFPGSSPALQLNLAEKLLRDASAQIAKRGEMTVMQRPAPYLLGTYPAADHQTNLAHLQLVIDYSDQYYWISYTAPAAVYQKYTPGFATLLKTLQIKPPTMTPSGSDPVDAASPEQ